MENKDSNQSASGLINHHNHVLSELSLRYKRLFEAAQDGIILFSFPECLIEDANPYILDILKYKKEDLLGKQLWELGLLKDKERALKVQETLIDKGYVRYEDLDLLKKDGEQISVEFLCNSYQLNSKKVIQCNIRDITAKKEAYLALDQERARLAQQIFETVNSLSNVIEARDPYTAGHQKRVTDLAIEIAREMSIAPNIIDGLKFACLIHDVGKISIPVEILTKPSVLNSLEIAMLKSHVQAGYEILKPLSFPWPVAKIILQHHERIDGSGYPKALKGEEICLEARILAVADTMEAMTSIRPYRGAFGLEVALKEIESNAGKLYDSIAVKACLALFREHGYQFPKVEELIGHKL
mgnify:CR=1 FL=1